MSDPFPAELGSVEPLNLSLNFSSTAGAPYLIIVQYGVGKAFFYRILGISV